jgi:DNA helicase-2/ATP-dependent DNA helicase PcrA
MELRAVAAEYDPLPRETSLASFLEEVALVSDVDNLSEIAEAPTLLTLHSAKGLEFPVVFIVGMEEGILPHSRSFGDPEQMEEERRLCYVGITRAKERLYLLHAFRRSRYGGDDMNAPSRFLVDVPLELIRGKREAPGKAAVRRASTWRSPSTPSVTRATSTVGRIPAATPQFTVGQPVRHPLFGDGTVIESRMTRDDEEVKVAFPGAGIKTLLASFAKLEDLSNETP